MDLVDIDKVLDTLELSVAETTKKEISHNNAAKSETIFPAGVANSDKLTRSSNGTEENIPPKMASSCNISIYRDVAQIMHTQNKVKIDDDTLVRECTDNEEKSFNAKKTLNYDFPSTVNANVSTEILSKRNKTPNTSVPNCEFSSSQKGNATLNETLTDIEAENVGEVEVLKNSTSDTVANSELACKLLKITPSNELKTVIEPISSSFIINENRSNLTTRIEDHKKKELCENEDKYVVQTNQRPIAFGFGMEEFSDADLNDMLQKMENNDPLIKSNTTDLIQVVPVKNEIAEIEKIESENSDQTDTHPNSSYSSSESSLECDNMMSKEVHIIYGKELIHKEKCFNTAERPQRPTTLDLKTVKVLQDSEKNDDIDNKTLNHLKNNATPVASINDNGSILCHSHEGQIETENGAAATEGVVNQDYVIGSHASFKDNIGKVPPVWVPDHMAGACMQCQTRFTMIKRRHHCRACGQVLCSTCCSQKFKLNFVTTNLESRVCVQCYLLLTQNQPKLQIESDSTNEYSADSSATHVLDPTLTVNRSPNPNNPMEYCSTIPPHKQIDATTPVIPPTVIVPIGVLKKDGSHSSNSSNSSAHMRKRKTVMFSDGIAPGSELASIEHEWNEPKDARRTPSKTRSNQGSLNDSKPSTPAKEIGNSSRDLTTMGLVAQLFRSSVVPTVTSGNLTVSSNDVITSNSIKIVNADDNAMTARANRLIPTGYNEGGCFIPKENDNYALPPLYECKQENNSDYSYKEVANNQDLIDRLRNETLQFALTKNLYVLVKVVHLKCCMNRTVINYTTQGMHHVGNDEIIILLEFKAEIDDKPQLPVDVFQHLYDIYREAELGRPISELSYTNPKQSRFLGSREYGGFIFIRSTFQCLQDVLIPENPYLIGILIHRYEVPWAKIFPLRLTLRLGAQYRYYPCPHISIRNRDSVYAEIAQTIINFLADFRNYSYTLPFIRGMLIHMEERQTTVLIPRNRQEDVIKAINNSSDHILAFGGNFSKIADGHLVCMQNVNDDRSEMYAYSTQAINIQGQPRKVTGANFLVLNEALKSTSGLSGKCSLVEDGLMVQILPTKMEEVRTALRNQQDIDIICGPLNAEEQQTEIVKFKWIANDRDFNIGVKSPIDGQSLEGVYNIRVHASFNYANTNYSIRLTDIYIIKFEDWNNSDIKAYPNGSTSVNVTHLAEQLGRSVSLALVPFLDLLASNNNWKLGLRATLQQDNVSYEAGSRGAKLPPLYMNALDNHLIPTLHNESNDIDGDPIILELIFYILNV